MKPTAYFINVGRGELVDQQALAEPCAIAASPARGSTCSQVEPLPLDDPLLALDNVILTPHWSASTSDVWRATGAAMAEGMLRTAHGEVPENVVNAEVVEQPLFREKLARFRGECLRSTSSPGSRTRSFLRLTLATFAQECSLYRLLASGVRGAPLINRRSETRRAEMRQFQPMRFLPLSCLFWPSIAVAALVGGLRAKAAAGCSTRSCCDTREQAGDA